MKLSPDGKMRLAVLKRALAVGLSLARLLAVAVGCEKGSGEGESTCLQEEVILEDVLQLELDPHGGEDAGPMGDLIPADSDLVDSLSELIEVEDIGPLDCDFSSEPIHPPVPLRELPDKPLIVIAEPIIFKGVAQTSEAKGDGSGLSDGKAVGSVADAEVEEREP